MTPFRADLHCHSTCSDGSMTPEQLLHHASAKKLSGLSITDHDNIDAYQTAIPIAKELGIQIVSGVEFSSVLDDVSVHILGYGFSLNDLKLNAFCEKHRQRREERHKEILKKLTQKGLPLSEEELILSTCPTSDQGPKTMVGRPHIAKLMVKKGYVQNIKEAFQKYIGEGKPCYVQGSSFTVEETIEIIHAANGFALIAHPHLINDSKILLKLLRMNFDGIECYYSKFPPSVNERWLKIAKEKKWRISGGSDFHGDIKPLIPLGCSWVGEEHFNPLYNHFLKQ